MTRKRPARRAGAARGVGAASAATPSKRLSVVVHNAAPGQAVPARARIREWTAAALEDRRGEVTVRIVTAVESAELNARYRAQSGPTNVLSFPAGAALPLPQTELEPLGDVVVCAEVVAREAREQDKTLDAHWAHMLIHGALHLLGYDHVTESEARRMEAHERALLAALGFRDPYAARVSAGPAQRLACKPRPRSAR